MRRLFFAGPLLMTIASVAAAQSSSPTADATQPALGAGGNTAGPNALTGPNAGSAGPCTADTGCARFPVTPLGAANPSLAPRTSPLIGAAPAQTGSALTTPPLVASPNPTGSANPMGSTLASPGIGATLNQTGLNQPRSAGANSPSALQSSGTAGTPATRAPSLPSGAFQSQCANSPSCSAFGGQ